MADNDLQAELDSLFGNDSEKPAEEKAQGDGGSESTEAPKSGTGQKSMLGGGKGAKPLGKGLGKPAGAGVKPSASSTTGVKPVEASASPAPSAPAPASVAPAMAPVASFGVAPARSGGLSKALMALSALSLLFSLVTIVMITQVNSRLDSMTTAIETLSARQVEQAKEAKELNENQIKIAKKLGENLIVPDSPLQKNVRMLTEAVETLQERFGKR